MPRAQIATQQIVRKRKEKEENIAQVTRDIHVHMFTKKLDEKLRGTCENVWQQHSVYIALTISRNVVYFDMSHKQIEKKNW